MSGWEIVGLAKKLQELFLQETNVTFDMTAPEFGLRHEMFLGSSLNMDVWDFIHPCAILAHVRASKCGLFGRIKGVHLAVNASGGSKHRLYWVVNTLDYCPLNEPHYCPGWRANVSHLFGCESQCQSLEDWTRLFPYFAFL